MWPSWPETVLLVSCLHCVPAGGHGLVFGLRLLLFKAGDMTMSDQQKKEPPPYVGIAAVVGGITIGMIAMILLWAEGSEWIVVPVVACMSLFGSVLGYYAGKNNE